MMITMIIMIMITVEQVDRILKSGRTYGCYYGMVIVAALCHVTQAEEGATNAKFENTLAILKYLGLL